MVGRSNRIKLCVQIPPAKSERGLKLVTKPSLNLFFYLLLVSLGTYRPSKKAQRFLEPFVSTGSLTF